MQLALNLLEKYKADLLLQLYHFSTHSLTQVMKTSRLILSMRDFVMCCVAVGFHNYIFYGYNYNSRDVISHIKLLSLRHLGTGFLENICINHNEDLFLIRNEKFEAICQWILVIVLITGGWPRWLLLSFHWGKIGWCSWFEIMISWNGGSCQGF